MPRTMSDEVKSQERRDVFSSTRSCKVPESGTDQVPELTVDVAEARRLSLLCMM